MSKKSQHVVSNQNGGWSVRKTGASRASKVFSTQNENVFMADNYDRLITNGYSSKDIERLPVNELIKAMRNWVEARSPTNS